MFDIVINISLSQMLDELLAEEAQHLEDMQNEQDLALFEATLVDEGLPCPVCK